MNADVCETRLHTVVELWIMTFCGRGPPIGQCKNFKVWHKRLCLPFECIIGVTPYLYSWFQLRDKASSCPHLTSLQLAPESVHRSNPGFNPYSGITVGQGRSYFFKQEGGSTNKAKVLSYGMRKLISLLGSLQYCAADKMLCVCCSPLVTVYYWSW